MSKLVRFPEGIMTEKEWCDRYAERVEPYEAQWQDYYERSKFNRMSSQDEQDEYIIKLKAKASKPHFRAWRGETFYDISKKTYDAIKKS